MATKNTSYYSFEKPEEIYKDIPPEYFNQLSDRIIKNIKENKQVLLIDDVNQIPTFDSKDQFKGFIRKSNFQINWRALSSIAALFIVSYMLGLNHSIQSNKSTSVNTSDEYISQLTYSDIDNEMIADMFSVKEKSDNKEAISDELLDPLNEIIISN